MDDLFACNSKFWKIGIGNLAGDYKPDYIEFSDEDQIIKVLNNFVGNNVSHTHLSPSGGYDFEEVVKSPEKGFMDGITNDAVYRFKAARLIFRTNFMRPIESFALIECEDVPLMDIYENHENIKRSDEDEGAQDILEVRPGVYVNHSVRIRGFLKYDKDGNEVEFPESARMVCRIVRGKLLIVSKRSIWNHVSEFYDGRHKNMTHKEINSMIWDKLTELMAR